MSFSENLREVLDLRDMQIKELSAKTGISKNTIDNYLSGQKSLPNIESGVKIARVLGVTAEYLVTGKAASKKEENVLENSTIKTEHSEKNDYTSLLKDLKYLTKSDLAAIKAIVQSLARR